MRGKVNTLSGESPQFLVRKHSRDVGLVVGVSKDRAELWKTIELASGEQKSAPASQFRAANDEEVEEYHRAAAMLKPFDLPEIQPSRLVTQ